MLIFGLLVYAKVFIPESLAGYHTRFLLSINPKMGIELDKSNGIFYTTELDKSESSIFRINKDGDFYTLKNKTSNVCNSGGVLRICPKPTKFRFKAISLGYKIKSSGQCLTAGEVMKFEVCDSKSKAQIFVFDLDKSLNCMEPTLYRGKKEPLKPETPLTYTQKKAILDKEVAKLKIDNPETKRILGKSWFSKGWGFPKFPFC